MRNKIILFIFIAFAAFLYLLTLRGGLGNATTVEEVSKLTSVGQVFESSHERSPYASMISLQNNRIDLPVEWANFASPDVGYINGKFYSFFPAGIPVLMSIAYKIGAQYNAGVLGSFAIIPLLALINIFLLLAVSRQIFKFPIWGAILSALIFAFASTSWSYAITVYQHIPTVTCLLFGFYAAWRYGLSSKRAGWLWAGLAGAAYGASIFIDYPNALLLAPIMVYLLIKSVAIRPGERTYSVKIRLSVIVALLAFGFLSGLHLYYNAKVFGSPLQFHNPAPRYTPETFEKLVAKQSGNDTTNAASAVSIFSEESLARGLYELFVASDKGILFFSPIFIFALWGIVRIRKYYSLEWGTFLSFAIINVFMYASFGDPWGGWAFGPRYIIPSMAVLSIFAVTPLLNGRALLLKKATALLLIIYSTSVSVIGVVTTNLVPPKVEADYLHLKYNFLRNWDFIKENISTNFVYKNYLADQIALWQYAFLLSALVVFASWIVLFILPYFEKEKKQND